LPVPAAFLPPKVGLPKAAPSPNAAFLAAGLLSLALISSFFSSKPNPRLSDLSTFLTISLFSLTVP